ncbi:MAG: methyltransferase domain-containing protein [Propionibacterium sp.]|nr:methyltransferase domain-containing protein [Propionibacterium sp.]
MTEAKWDARYGGQAYAYGEAPNGFLREQAKLLRPNSRVLCVGDGEGRNGVYLASLGHDVVSLDASGVGLGKARALAERRGVEIETWHVDLEHYLGLGDPEQPWDAVVHIFCHLPPRLRRDVALGFTAQTRSGGRLLYEAYTPAQLLLGTGGPKELDQLVTRRDVVEDWGEGWEVDVRIVERRIDEGAHHRGLASVVQAVGQRR